MGISIALLGVLRAWQLASLRAGNPRERHAEAAVPLILSGNLHTVLSSVSYWLHKGMAVRRRGEAEATWRLAAAGLFQNRLDTSSLNVM